MNIQSAINAGLFVQFVADKWNSSGSTTNLDNQAVVSPTGAPVVAGKSYTVKKTIYACDLATVIDPRKGWVTIGIVAINDADPNDVVVAIRGTLTVWEWLQDAKFLYKPFTNIPSAPLTEDGFTDMYQSFSFAPEEEHESFLTDLTGLFPSTATVTIAGHSLGAALATLFALDLAVHSALTLALYTLASPRVGDLSFSQLFNHTVPNAFRIANRLDIVPKVPPPIMYIHVGDETELIPSRSLKFDLACEHHLTSYFNMLGALLGQQDAYPIQPDCLKAAG